jgi:hypothetical protein
MVDERVLVQVADHGPIFPTNHAQLHQAMTTLFASWRVPRAVAHCRAQAISEALCAPVTVQAMVFGKGSPGCSTVGMCT